jgi:hypothetical protein
VVISHEVFAAASTEQATGAIGDLDGEVHLICSARDLRRQVPAEWQEGVKHRRSLPYAAFCADLTSAAPKTEIARWFWTVQDIPAVLGRWGSRLPPEHVHLVTVPPPEAPRALLIDRFLGLLQIDPDWLQRTSDRANPSMGAVETTVIRRLNQRLPSSVLDGEIYRPYVRELLVHRTLATRPGAIKTALPTELDEWVAGRTGEWLERLEEAGYDVVGDLAELAPGPPTGTYFDPDAAPADDQLEVALDIAETLLREIAVLVQPPPDEPAPAPPPPGRWMRVKQRVVRAAGSNPAIGLAYRGYRRVRRR